MILSGQTIRRYCSKWPQMVQPFNERTEIPFDGRTLTYGVGPAGYDVRVEFDEDGKKKFAVLQPGAFMLASTIERFEMPVNIMAEVKDKSSWARRGLAVQNTVIEPGWRGYLTLELTNHGNEVIELIRGMPIAQIVFEFVDESVTLPYKTGKYQDQRRGPQGAR